MKLSTAIAALVAIALLAAHATQVCSAEPALPAWINLSDYGAQADGQTHNAVASIAKGEEALTVNTPLFRAIDVGKGITIEGAGSVNGDLVTTIDAVNSPQDIVLHDPATQTLVQKPALVEWGTDLTSAATAAKAAIPKGSTVTIHLGSGTYYMSQPVEGTDHGGNEQYFDVVNDNGVLVGHGSRWGWLAGMHIDTYNGKELIHATTRFSTKGNETFTLFGAYNGSENGNNPIWFKYTSEVTGHGRNSDSGVVFDSTFESLDGVAGIGIWVTTTGPLGSQKGAHAYYVHAAIAAGTSLLTSEEPIFASDNVGKIVNIQGAGPTGGWWSGAVNVVVSSTAVLVVGAPPTTIKKDALTQIVIGHVNQPGFVTSEINTANRAADYGWGSSAALGVGSFKFVAELGAPDAQGRAWGTNLSYAIATDAHGYAYEAKDYPIKTSFGVVPRFYNGLLVAPDSIARYGRGIYLGGGIPQTPSPIPHTPLQADLEWEHGIRLDGGIFGDGNALILNSRGQAIAWTNSSCSAAHVPDCSAENGTAAARLAPTGAGNNIGLNLTTAGSGTVQVNGDPIATQTFVASGYLPRSPHIEFGGPAATPLRLDRDCGIAPKVAGNDNVGRVSFASRLCTLIFATAWNNPPVCQLINETNPDRPLRPQTTTTSLTIHNLHDNNPIAASPMTVAYQCAGYR